MITADELRGSAPFALPRGARRRHVLADGEPATPVEVEERKLASKRRAMKWRAANREKYLAYMRDWRKKNRAKANEMLRAWRQKHKERWKLQRRKDARKFRAKMTPEQKAAWAKRCREYRAAHRDHINAQRRARDKAKRQAQSAIQQARA